jgi:ABC-type Fe3+-citrate transport system substrate-binding protein
MNKIAPEILDQSVNEPAQEDISDRDQLYLKLKKEAEIRMKLDDFARELSQLKLKRNQH